MQNIIMPVFLLSALAGTGYYLSYKIYSGIASFFPKIRLWPVLVLVFLLMLVMILGFARALIPMPVELKQLLGTVSGYCMGFFLYLLLFMLAADLILLLPRLLKLAFTAHRLFKGVSLLCVLLLTVSTCTYGFMHVQKIHRATYSIAIEHKKDLSDLNLVMISDLHLGAIGSEKRLQAVVEEINAQNPDIICIAGDFFDTDFNAIKNPQAALQTLRELRATYGIYASLGNHDGGETHAQMVAFLKNANIQLLNDTYTVIDSRLVLVGRLDASAIGGYNGQKRKPFHEIYTPTDSTLPVIVLDHNPVHVDEYSSEADLILSGHTHKGQVFPANLFTNMLYTVDYGYYQKNSNSPQVIVSSGVGAWGMPMRVGSNCEIVTVHFTAQN